MSTIAITQLPIKGTTPESVQVLKVYPKTGKVNLLFNSEGERKNDGTTKTGSQLNFGLLESDTGNANDWTPITRKATATDLTATASASHALGTALTVGATVGIATGDVVAVKVAAAEDKPTLNGVFSVLSRASASATTLVIDLPWSADNASLTSAAVVEIDPIIVKPGGSEVANLTTQKKLINIVGWGTDSGGYARLDLQFNGLMGFGQIDIEVASTKQGYGFDGNGAAGVGGRGSNTAWPEVP